MSQLVVANLLNGRIVKGTTLDASCRQPRCHIRTPEGPVTIELAEVKAIYFVRDHAGDPVRLDDQTEAPDDPRRHGMCRGKNIGVLVNAGAVRSIRELPETG